MVVAAHPRPQSLLYGRWLYVLLGLAALAAYGRLLTGKPLHSPDVIEEIISKADLPPSFSAVDVTWAQVVERVHQRPAIAIQLGIWAGLLAGLALAGTLLTLQDIRTGRARRLLQYRTRISMTLWSYGDLARMMLLVGLLISLWPFVRISLMAWVWLGLVDDHVWGLISTIGFDLLVIMIVLAFAATRRRVLFSLFGRTWRNARAAIAQSVRGYVTLFPWIFSLLWFLVTACERLGIQPPVEPIHELLFVRQERWILALTVLLACVIGPIAEELFFRGVIFSAVRRYGSRLTAMLVSGGLFAAVHTNLVGFVPILLLGCLLAERYERSGSLAGPIAVHMLHNTLLIGLGLTIRAVL